ncbi:hypothetical protein RHGRI_024008 [Rhododendron griersonianum]|uniref:Uncharacterized protein n=1 Tax=Rhododendron griersonianum TaxID=479676 RepID=A0AAV6J916_9ERIC|nr:hypothetical protein RHGRI_024008 [Rhododendron griersonianum]
MAIRVLTRPTSHRVIASTCKPPPSLANPKLRCFSSIHSVFHSVVSSCPSVLEFEFLKDWEMGISNVNSSMVLNVLEVSRKFSLGPETLSSDGTVTRVLGGFPMVIVMDENGLGERIQFWVGIGFDTKQIDRIFNLFPSILVFGEFEELGFTLDATRREVVRDPSVLRLELGELSRCLELLGSLKCRVPIKEKIYSEGAFRAGIEVKPRLPSR